MARSVIDFLEHALCIAGLCMWHAFAAVCAARPPSHLDALAALLLVQGHHSCVHLPYQLLCTSSARPKRALSVRGRVCVGAAQLRS
jgi:hypothetical protein